MPAVAATPPVFRIPSGSPLRVVLCVRVLILFSRALRRPGLPPPVLEEAAWSPSDPELTLRLSFSHAVDLQAGSCLRLVENLDFSLLLRESSAEDLCVYI